MTSNGSLQTDASPEQRDGDGSAGHSQQMRNLDVGVPLDMTQEKHFSFLWVEFCKSLVQPFPDLRRPLVFRYTGSPLRQHSRGDQRLGMTAGAYSINSRVNSSAVKVTSRVLLDLDRIFASEQTQE